MTEELSANKRKAIAALRTPKHRREQRLFVAEGTKCIEELLPYFRCELVAATSAWLESHDMTAKGADKVYKATRADIERMTSLSTASEVIGVFRLPERSFDMSMIREGLTVALDGVQDPGNLGTIIRCCDWFGVNNIICSKDTVDVFNPKVIQSTMGAISRVNVWYMELPKILAECRVPVYGTFLDGENIYHCDFPADGIIVMGNEGKGISDSVAQTITRKLFIPPYPVDALHVESLNVSMATAITLSQFRR